MSHQPSTPANPANVPSMRFFPNIGVTANMRVLDVGCGNGDLSRTMAALVGRGGEIVGIDRSESALQSARATPSHPDSAAIHYETVDLSKQFPDLGHFDAIVGRRVLMYLPDAAATLSQLANFAKPGTILAFQEHARADLPSGAGDLTLHRQCYEMAWKTVAAEQGDVTLGYRLANLVRAAGFTLDRAYSEGVLMQPWEQSFLPTLIEVMLPRMIERGVVAVGEIDPETLADRIDAERRGSGHTIVWDLAFLVSGRFAGKAAQ